MWKYPALEHAQIFQTARTLVIPKGISEEVRAWGWVALLRLAAVVRINECSQEFPWLCLVIFV